MNDTSIYGVAPPLIGAADGDGGGGGGGSKSDSGSVSANRSLLVSARDSSSARGATVDSNGLYASTNAVLSQYGSSFSAAVRAIVTALRCCQDVAPVPPAEISPSAQCECRA